VLGGFRRLVVQDSWVRTHFLLSVHLSRLSYAEGSCICRMSVVDSDRLGHSDRCQSHRDVPYRMRLYLPDILLNPALSNRYTTRGVVVSGSSGGDPLCPTLIGHLTSFQVVLDQGLVGRRVAARLMVIGAPMGGRRW
jgi:hypothetical protein